MMKGISTVLTLATMLVPGATAQGQERRHVSPAEEAMLLMERAGELHGEHRLEDALDLYADAVIAQDDANELPRTALERIATIHLAAGRTAEAARSMDRLAARAEWLGYPEAQAQALLEAAVLHQLAGAAGAARERVRRLVPLLDSPHLTRETMMRIRARMGVAAAAG